MAAEAEAEACRAAAEVTVAAVRGDLERDLAAIVVTAEQREQDELAALAREVRRRVRATVDEEM
jgi:hypothetical protein